MNRIEHLVFEEPVCDREVHVGTFFYLDQSGEETEAEFFVRCCDLIDSVEEFEDEEAYLRRARRQVEYNEQWSHQFEALDRAGCKDIRFVSLKPNPII